MLDGTTWRILVPSCSLRQIESENPWKEADLAVEKVIASDERVVRPLKVGV